jgi:hypothetical protein
MKEIVWNEKGKFIYLMDKFNGTTVAVTRSSSVPVNPAKMPPDAAIYVDPAAFDAMCMAYVKNKGAQLLIEAAERRPDKMAMVMAATVELVKDLDRLSQNNPKIIDDCIAVAEKIYERVSARKY